SGPVSRPVPRHDAADWSLFARCRGQVGCASCVGWRPPGTPQARKSESIPQESGAPLPTYNHNQVCRRVRPARASSGTVHIRCLHSRVAATGAHRKCRISWPFLLPWRGCLVGLIDRTVAGPPWSVKHASGPASRLSYVAWNDRTDTNWKPSMPDDVTEAAREPRAEAVQRHTIVVLPSDEARVPGRSLVLAACLMATFMAAIESTIVATTLPTIVSDLGGFDLFSWVFTIFLLTQAVSIPIYGRLADMFGRKKVFF